jgi:hypothetical protein
MTRYDINKTILDIFYISSRVRDSVPVVIKEFYAKAGNSEGAEQLLIQL